MVQALEEEAEPDHANPEKMQRLRAEEAEAEDQIPFDRPAEKDRPVEPPLGEEVPFHPKE